MAIVTTPNSAYGSLTGNNKYSPLVNTTFSDDKDHKKYLNQILLNRWNLLRTTGLLPQPLSLEVNNWATTITGEGGKKPPLVVISSNRSAWIKAGIEALAAQPFASYDNASDVRALTATERQGVSPPIYCPSRIGKDAGPRNVYIVVHSYEYDTYKENLAGTGINVVGWSFRRPRLGAPRITGFGASRFAAIEFCKELRRAATVDEEAPWDYAWLLDDNVVLFKNFAGYKAVEDAMEPEYVGAGFSGDAKLDTFSEVRDWAIANVDRAAGRQATALAESKPPGLLQQAVLWNIDYLTRNRLNFGPAFVASAEDLSFTNYIKNKDLDYFFYKKITITKEQTSIDDNSAGSRSVKYAREDFTALFAEIEGNDTDSPSTAVLPPPIKIQVSAKPPKPAKALAKFVAEDLQLASPWLREHLTEAKLNTAKSHTVEQITSGAIDNNLVTDDALDKTFKINGTGADAIPIVRVNTVR